MIMFFPSGVSRQIKRYRGLGLLNVSLLFCIRHIYVATRGGQQSGMPVKARGASSFLLVWIFRHLLFQKSNKHIIFANIGMNFVIM
jgi:hypothetical protein